MLHRQRFPVLLLVAGIGLSISSPALRSQDDSYRGRKYKAPPAAAHIEVTVLKDYNGKPIENAHVIFHPTQGDKDTGALEVKTNDEGKAVIDVIPIGDTVTLQVIVNGYQTYGQSYKVDKPEMAMEVRLKRPGSQYSIYKSNDGNSGSSSGSSSSGSSNATPPAPGNKSSGNQPNSQSQPPPK
ncbi:MAG: carboxypeptidase-like regulatory domain-containing protein [Terracidiphilus sp.]